MPLSPRPFALAFAVIVALLALPIFLVDVVPLLDYPAHLTRVTLLSHLPLDPVVARAYTVDIRPLANLAMDIFVPALAPILGVALALKLFIALGIAFWLLGAVLIYRAVWGDLSPQPLLAAFFVLNTNFTDGYFNYHVATGLALVLAGLWLARPRHGPLFLLGMAVGCVILLFSHLMALAVFLLLVGGFEAGRRLRWPLDWPGLVRAGVAIAAVALPAFLLWAFVIERGAGGPVGYKWIANAVAIAIYSSDFGGFRLNPVPALALLAGLAVAAWTRRLEVAHSMLPALALLTLAMLLMPATALGGAGLHVRLPAVVLVVLLATVRVRFDEVAARRLTLAVLVLTAAGAALLAAQWLPRAAAIDRFRVAARAALPEGARLMTALAAPASASAWHVPDLMIAERKAFVPAFFTLPGQSTIRLNPAYAGIGARTAEEGASLWLADLTRLLAPGGPAFAADELPRYRPYLTLRCDFDAVALFGAPAPGETVPDALQPIHADPDFTLFRVARPAGIACPPR